MEPGRTPSEPEAKSSLSVRNVVSVATSTRGRLLIALTPGRSILSPVAKSVMVSMVLGEEWVRGEPRPKAKVSLPAPPVRVSASRPPVSVSLPSPPCSRSLPSLPIKASLSAPPASVSLPAPPSIESAPALPLRLSAPRPPLRLSLPAPPISVSAPAPPVALTGRSTVVLVSALPSSRSASVPVCADASNTGVCCTLVKTPSASVS